MKKLFVIAILTLTLSMSTLSSGQSWVEEFFDRDDDIMGKVKLEGSNVGDGIVRVDLLMEDFKKPVLGISFDLHFDENLKFLRYEPGLYLEQGGDPIYMVMEQKKDAGGYEVFSGVDKSDHVKFSNDYLVYGVTLKRDDSFPVGSGLLSSFYFEIKGTDNVHLEFGRGVVSTLDTVRQDLDNVVWNSVVLDKDGENVEPILEIETNEQQRWAVTLGNFVMGALFLILIIIGYRLVKGRFVTSRGKMDTMNR